MKNKVFPTPKAAMEFARQQGALRDDISVMVGEARYGESA